MRVQAGCGVGYGSAGLRLILASLLLLSGCSSFPASMNPVTWWHDLQGGKIAEDRPPPPGTDQPYPNLASVPPKPAQPDRAALTNIANALIADRTNAQHIAAAAPIADPSLPSASPGLFGRGTVPPPAPPPPSPPGAQTTSATLPAAEAPPAPAAPPAAPAKAPVGNVESAPLAPPGATAQPPAAEAGPPPPVPNAPPPPPKLPGVATAAPPGAGPPPSKPPSAPTTVAAATPSEPPAANAADSVTVTFITGSAVLPPSGADILKQLAARRGNGVITVTGYGDATSDDPTAQSGALALGLQRAQAMAAVLTSAGVPPSAVEVDAAALGRGGTARLMK